MPGRRSGAGTALIASNTAHLAAVLDAIGPPATPYIHIADATTARAVAAGHRRLGLLGTRYTMTSSLFPDRLERTGIDLVTPPDEAMDFIQEVYFGELVKGVFRAETPARTAF